MKTQLIIPLALLLVICTGCKKHECAELSWTDYNTVEDVHCNFKYFKDEYMAHKGDTLKVYGWLFDRTSENSPQYQILTNRKDIQFSYNWSLLFTNPFVSLTLQMPYDSIMPEKPYDNLLYVTGIIDYYDDDCTFDIRLNAFNIINQLLPNEI